MIQDSGMQSWEQVLVYSIEKDQSAEYDTNKILFHNRGIRTQLRNNNVAYTYGLYGLEQIIEKQINDTYHEMEAFEFKQELIKNDKGVIVFVFTENVIIPCLIFSKNFFSQKPIDEKSIELTLFRILTDLTQTIIICFDETIYCDWYAGDQIPFSVQHSSRMLKYIIEQNKEEKLQTQVIDFKSLIPPGQLNWKVLPPTNHSSTFLLYDIVRFTPQVENELKISLEKIIISMIYNTFKTSDSQMDSKIRDNLRQEFQISKVIDHLSELQKQYLKDIAQLWEDIRRSLQKPISKLTQDHQKQETLLQYFQNRFKQMLIISEGQQPFTSDYHKDHYQHYYKQICISNLQSDYGSARSKIQLKLNYLFQQAQTNEIPIIIKDFKKEQKNENNIVYSRCKFTATRSTDKENTVEKICASTNNNQFIIDSASLTKGFIEQIKEFYQSDQQIKIIDLFITTQDQPDILIVQKENKILIIQLQNNGQIKIIRKIEQIQRPLFYFNQQQKVLYGFNHLSINSIKLPINENWKIYDEKIFYQTQPHILQKIIYLSCSEIFIGLNYDGAVFKWNGNLEKFTQIKAFSFDQSNNEMRSQNFKPSFAPGTQYNQLEACPSGKRFFLSNSNVIDIYDESYELILNIPLPGRFILFTDQSDAFLVAFDELKWKNHIKSALMIPNLSQNQQIKQINIEEPRERKIGNPGFDILRGSQVKYGPVQTFLLNNKYQKINLLIINSNDKIDQITKYLKKLKINDNFQFFFPNDAQISEAINETTQKKISTFFFFTYTRIPLQLCTIENNQLTPLIDGFRQAINCNQSLTIPQRAKLLTLGYIEEYLMNLNEKIFVVSIIGRQSSGKSYLLNRLFGTRFSVAASRCTDGIWASMTQINNSKFLILDCEGLFSTQRTKNEETQLLAFLASICDVTILNQDLSFNRYLDELLDNLTSAKGKLSGDSLFKGTLLIALRDISLQDSFGANEQLIQNIQTQLNIKKSSFLYTLFNAKLNVKLFSYFEFQEFPNEVENLREEFLQMAIQSSRWLNGKDLIQTIKILLIQLETSDAENTDQLHFKFQIEEIVDKLKKQWTYLDCDEKIYFEMKQYFQKNYQLWSENLENVDRQQFCDTLMTQIRQDLGLNKSIDQHNINQILIQEFLNQLLSQRKIFLQNFFENEIKKMKNGKLENEIVQVQKIALIRYIEEQERFYQLCSMQCSQCFLNCSKFQNHSNFFQIEINKKDDQLQSLLRKYESKFLEFNENQSQINKCKEQEQQIINETESLNSDIIYLENLKIWIQIKVQMKIVQECLGKNVIIAESNLIKPNFIKFLHSYGDIRQYRLNDHDHDEIHIEILDGEIINEKTIYEFMQSRLFLFIQQNKEISNNLKGLRTDQKELEKNNLNLNEQQKQLLSEQKSIDFALIQQEESLKEFQLQFKISEKDIAESIPQIKVLEEQLNQDNFHGLLNETSPNPDFFKMKDEIKLQLEQSDIQLKQFKLEINKNKEKLQNFQFEISNKSKNLIQRVNQIPDQQFLQNCQSQVLNYQTLKFQKSQLLEELDVIESKIIKQIQYQAESKFLFCKIKTIDLKQYTDFFKVKEILNNIKQNQVSQIISLEEDDVELKQQILKKEEFNSENSSQFKQNYIQLKLINFKAQIEDEQQQSDQEIKLLEGAVLSLSNEQETLQSCLKYCTVKHFINGLMAKKAEIEAQIDMITKQIQVYFDRIQIISQLQLELESNIQLNLTRYQQQKEKEESQAKKLALNLHCIKRIEQTSSYYENYKKLLQEFRNFEKELEVLEETLLKQEKSLLFEGSTLSQDQIQQIIEEKKNKLEELKQQFHQKQEDYESLLIVQNDLSLISKLKDGLDKLKIQEKQEHSCLRDSHLCDQACEVCQDTQCKKQAGHQQHHLCDLPKHYCIAACQILGCDKNCRLVYLHEGQHNCGSPHSCKILCQYCGGDCQFDFTSEHQEHICKISGCIQKCSLCGRSCRHDHSHSRAEGQVHFCENQHSCEQSCTSPGVCVWEYKEERREWKSSLSSFAYTYFKQIDGGKQKCSIQIDSGKISHSEIHSCKVEVHRCGAKCPECDGLCTKENSHSGFHFAKQHRNKDSQIFTLEIGQGMELELQENLETHKYQVGETSSPETCSQSCTRRSRAHFHLMRCQGGEFCLGKSNKYARHQKQKYQGFEDFEFDEVQCVEFWKLQEWEHPSSVGNGDVLADIQACNFFCPLCQETQKKFCSEPAWHTESNKYQHHQFWCKADHESEIEFQGLDVVFVIDATGSMGTYIEKAKLMIKNIIAKAKLKAGKNLRFGVVAYRDHPPQEESFVTQEQQLGSEKQALVFLEKLKAHGGGDYPEAVLDGLQVAVNFKWQKNHDKMIFLIGDAPPHGKQYSSRSNWPDGCPCGINEKILFKQMSDLQIKLKILELNDGLNLMIKEFQKLIACEILKENSKIDFVTQVVQKVCQQIEMREITYRKD